MHDGTKNCLRSILPQTTTNHGVVCVSNADGSYTLNGTSENYDTLFDITGYISDFAGAEMWLSGCPEGGNYESKYALFMAYERNKNTFAKDIGTGASVTIPNEPYRVCMLVRAGCSVKDLVFRPMLCKKSLYDIDPTFKQYVPNNAKLALKRTVITGTTSASGNLELKGLMYNNVVVVSVTEQLTTGDYKCAYTPAVNNDKWTSMCRYLTHPNEIPAEVEKTVVVYYYEI